MQDGINCALPAVAIVLLDLDAQNGTGDGEGQPLLIARAQRVWPPRILYLPTSRGSRPMECPSAVPDDPPPWASLLTWVGQARHAPRFS